MKIGVICSINSMGDHIVNLQALYAIKKLYPKDELIFIIRKKFKALFERLNFIDRLEFIDRGGGGFKSRTFMPRCAYFRAFL